MIELDFNSKSILNFARGVIDILCLFDSIGYHYPQFIGFKKIKPLVSFWFVCLREIAFCPPPSSYL